ncbi:D-aspartate oxidase [Brachionus plicatilis]|uniref:D-aspartate oxidase n=1 Tax=Brachionus plicatilis TaxID=10195 RepID=A0A3M7QUB3_BRAPC|nr:D-aspartate oxidase [Brachionus plicatilis]
MSLVRQNFHEEQENGINSQINLELRSAYIYRSMSSYFNRDDVALTGFARLFQKDSDDAKTRAEKLMSYLSLRGGKTLLDDVVKPGQQEWGAGVDALRTALNMEKEMYKYLSNLHEIGFQKKDRNFTDFLESEFLQEQIKHIKKLGVMITKLMRAGPGLGEYLFDKDLDNYMRIAIIGAGIIGITCAARILDQFPDCKIIIYADRFSPDTTSDVSAGFWEPYCISAEQAAPIIKWGKETYDIMLRESLGENADKYGIQALTAYVLQDTQQAKIPYWSQIVAQFRTLDKNDIMSIVNQANTHFSSGFSYLTTTVVVKKYIPELCRLLKIKGVTFVKKKLTNLNQFIDEYGTIYDYVINCTGLGAREFVPDTNVYPVKGQVLRVKAPWIKNCVMLDTNEVTYILPLSDMVVLGGTQECDTYSLEKDDNQLNQIVERCSKIYPSLKGAEVVSSHAGLRPCRQGGVRIELELINQAKVIHNYGHGGSGVTISWGCASEVVHCIEQDTRVIKSKL